MKYIEVFLPICSESQAIIKRMQTNCWGTMNIHRGLHSNSSLSRMKLSTFLCFPATSNLSLKRVPRGFTQGLDPEWHVTGLSCRWEHRARGLNFSSIRSPTNYPGKSILAKNQVNSAPEKYSFLSVKTGITPPNYCWHYQRFCDRLSKITPGRHKYQTSFCSLPISQVVDEPVNKEDAITQRTSLHLKSSLILKC